MILRSNASQRYYTCRDSNEARNLRKVSQRGLGVVNLEMRVETEDFVAQLAVEPAHDADDDDQHGDAQHDADDGNKRDDRDKRAFRFEIAETEEKFKRQASHRKQTE